MVAAAWFERRVFGVNRRRNFRIAAKRWSCDALAGAAA